MGKVSTWIHQKYKHNKPQQSEAQQNRVHILLNTLQVMRVTNPVVFTCWSRTVWSIHSQFTVDIMPQSILMRTCYLRYRHRTSWAHSGVLPLCWFYFEKYWNIFWFFINTEMAQMIQLFPSARQGPSYSLYSIPWLLMAWWRREPSYPRKFRFSNRLFQCVEDLLTYFCDTEWGG